MTDSSVSDAIRSKVTSDSGTDNGNISDDTKSKGTKGNDGNTDSSTESEKTGGK